jgi:hypothetical protein
MRNVVVAFLLMSAALLCALEALRPMLCAP